MDKSTLQIIKHNISVCYFHSCYGCWMLVLKYYETLLNKQYNFMWNLSKISIWKCKDKNNKQTKTWQESKVGLSQLPWQKWIAGAFLEWSCIRLCAGHPPVSAQALKQWFTENFSELLSFFKKSPLCGKYEYFSKIICQKRKRASIAPSISQENSHVSIIVCLNCLKILWMGNLFNSFLVKHITLHSTS